MGQEVMTSLPQGNHLLGFAEKKQPPWLKIGLIAISALVLVGAVLGISFFIFGKIPEPKNQVVLLAVRGGTELPSFVPQLWKDAAKSSRLPVFLGMTEESGKFGIFAITPRWSGLRADYRQDSGLFSFASAEKIELDGNVKTTLAAGAFINLLLNPAYLTLDQGKIAGTDSSLVSGPVDSSGWRTDLNLKHTEGQNASDEDIQVDLEAFPEVWLIIRRSLKDTNGIDIDEMPSSIGFSVNERGLDKLKLIFPRTPADTTLLKLAGSVGIMDLVPYTLPDGTSAIELKLPTQKLNQLGSQQNPDAWKNLSVEKGNLVDMGQAAKTDQAGCGPGRLVFKLSNTALSNVLNALQISKTADGGISGITNSLELHEDGGKMSACFK